ncbi:MAG: polysaccharide pyruvyl transferase family protein [Ruminococcus sp.]|nr:polysaccharide pyruvyl transferase family protein [Ruminococcus sp.]
MPRYLIRGGKLPYENIPTGDYLSRNLMGSNCGNFMYLHGIVRTLMTDSSVEFESTRYKYNYSADEMKRLNSRIDGFIIPLADAFRDGFINELKGLTRIVRELKCPSYVIGVGVAASAEQKFADGVFGFEQEAKDFCDAVLEKSGVIGVRGEDTGRFLEMLGYKEGEHFRVIGCPSLYTYGRELKIRDTVKTPESPAAFNMSHALVGRDFIMREAKQFRDIFYIPQLVAELQTLYWGTDFVDYLSGKDCDPDDELFPSSLRHPLYAENKVKFFVNVNEWVDFMKTRDIVFGTRLHGNITAVVAGAPSIIMAKDTRVRELSKFHGLTHVDVNDLPNYRDIWELIDSVDFHSPEKYHKKNFDNYIDFLHANGLKTIYDDDPDRKHAPLDDLIRENGVSNEIVSAVAVPKEVLVGRMLDGIDFLRARRKELNQRIANSNDTVKSLRAEVAEKNAVIKERDKEISSLKDDIDAADKENSRLKNIIGCRSVTMTIKARNVFLPKNKKIKL